MSSGPWKASNRWPEEKVELLRRLHADGFSYAQIANELNITRSTVSGKIARLDLSGLAPRPIGRSRKVRPSVTRLVNHGNRFDLSEVFVPDALPDELHADDIPLAQRRSVFTLDRTACRFPYGDPATQDFFFCGGAALEGRPYCAVHCHIAYRLPEPRADRRAA